MSAISQMAMAVGPRQIASIPYSSLAASTTTYVDIASVLSRHARERTFIVVDGTNVEVTAFSAAVYDSLVYPSDASFLQTNSIAIPGGWQITLATEAASGSMLGLLAAHGDSLQVGIAIGSTAPTSGNVIVDVTEWFGG